MTSGDALNERKTARLSLRTSPFLQLPRPDVRVRARPPAEQELGGVRAPLALGGGLPGNRFGRFGFFFSAGGSSGPKASESAESAPSRFSFSVASVSSRYRAPSAALVAAQRLCVSESVAAASSRTSSPAPRSASPRSVSFDARHRFSSAFWRAATRRPSRRRFDDVLAQLALDALASLAIRALVRVYAPLELRRAPGHRGLRLRHALLDARHVSRPPRPRAPPPPPPPPPPPRRTARPRAPRGPLPQPRRLPSSVSRRAGRGARRSR